MEMLKKTNISLGFELWILIILAREFIHEKREKELAKYGLTVRQAGILATIVEDLGGNAKAAEIARFSNRGPNSISNILKRMQRKGLIKKSKDPNKKNAARITLTEAGQEALMLANNRHTIHRIFDVLSEQECLQLQICLTKLVHKALEELNAGS